MTTPSAEVLECATQHHDRLGDALGCLGLVAQSPGESHHIAVHTEQRCAVGFLSCDRVDTYVVAEGPGPICPSLQFSAKPIPKSADQTGFILWGPVPNLAHPLLDAQACQAFLQRTTPKNNWRVCSNRTQDGTYVHTVGPANSSPQTPCELSCQVLFGNPGRHFDTLMCQGKAPLKVPFGGVYNW